MSCKHIYKFQISNDEIIYIKKGEYPEEIAKTDKHGFSDLTVDNIVNWR